jgi:hypothetical protein
LKEIAATVGNVQATELFNQEYEHLLNEVKVAPSPRHWMLVKMRGLLNRQAQFLMKEWLRLKRMGEMI